MEIWIFKCYTNRAHMYIYLYTMYINMYRITSRAVIVASLLLLIQNLCFLLQYWWINSVKGNKTKKISTIKQKCGKFCFRLQATIVKRDLFLEVKWRSNRNETDRFDCSKNIFVYRQIISNPHFFLFLTQFFLLEISTQMIWTNVISDFLSQIRMVEWEPQRL